jgi:hypothetical protein
MRARAPSSSTSSCTGPSLANIERVSALLKSGKSPRYILDMQITAADIIIATDNDLNFSLPQHCWEYCNTLGWFYDNFEHPKRAARQSYTCPAFISNRRLV